MLNIAVLVSGGGSNLQAIIDRINDGKLPCKINCVIADRNCYGLERASNYGIKTYLLDRKELKKNLSKEIDNILEGEVDLIVLAGFLSILDSEFTKKWSKKIINIHPSLLPKYGGPGMYGIKIHQAVIAAGEKESGCTVHYVDAGVDTGEIIYQEKVSVLENDTAETLQKKVLEIEHRLLPQAVMDIAGGN
ncbi:phosphoribosylglycinamide formyltransferase [uncultured Ilyobacter sp.]|uniref:phosphoribosylglycinamide formyltransferase n=1 Tax=uncultured Ilyobacter sp. TaxID=544433 RepID=UPI0029BFC265|nr:phosphoribosylglycinamide formyltransferase [uncultured Ilyobacter sp.]